jgi:hypothetical protein
MGEMGVKRFVAGLSLVALSVLGFSPTAGAVGQGACNITGTITFSSSSKTLSEGTWKIAPAVIDCQGIVAARRRITGRGPFSGGGTFRELSAGSGGACHQSGSGTVDYTIPTSGGDILVSEPITYTMVGVATFTTPTLRGAFQFAPSSGDCVTNPVTRATFVAEMLLYRYPRELPRPPGGGELPR